MQIKTIFDRFLLLLNGVALALVGFALLDFIRYPLAPDYIFHSTFYRAIVILLLTPLTILVAFLIIRRVPGNAVGRLLVVWSGTVAFGSLRAQIAPQPFALFYYYDMVFGWLALVLMLMHFPDGKLFSPRAAPWIYCHVALTAVMTNLLFFSTSTLQLPSGMANPVQLPALQQHHASITALALLFFMPNLLLALASPALRYRKGSPRERQQIKWLALFGVAFVVYIILALIALPLLTSAQVMNPGAGLSALFFYLTAGLFPPLAIGVAVLRYRLWDIDLIIRRTLVYSILTGLLTLIYFGSVLLLQALSQLITDDSQPPVATVLSTLAIAALFTPFRRGIQTFIDRRFYRRKYNAERVLAAFGATLREEVGLDPLTSSILLAVEDTMQPAHISLWLRQVETPP